jgi:GTPase SAR1 family protein
MERYQLGPNGALIFATDYIATRWGEIQNEIDGTGADFAIIDTPGQMELFTYRNSGSFIVSNISCEQKVVIFLVDATLTKTPTNLVSMAFLTYSIRLRLGAPQVVVLSKSDMVKDKIDEILNWTSSLTALEKALREEGGDGESYVFASNILRTMSKIGFAYGIIPTSSVTMDGFTNLSSALSRILTGGEEVVD